MRTKVSIKMSGRKYAGRIIWRNTIANPNNPNIATRSPKLPISPRTSCATANNPRMMIATP